MIAQTWGEFLTELWNTELWSWNSFVSVFVLALFIGIIKIFP